METVEHKGVDIKIYPDDAPMNSRVDWDNLGTMLCRHRRYDLGDDDGIDDSDCSSWEDVRDLIIKEEKPLVILPLYMYDHSGITINTTGFSCQWDSGQIGWIYVTKKSCKEMGVDPNDLEKLERFLLAEVDTYDQYVSGQVYGFSINHDTDDEIIKDSCWGFFGYDHEKSGLLDEARGTIDRALSSAAETA
jgi:hypothetical protein